MLHYFVTLTLHPSSWCFYPKQGAPGPQSGQATKDALQAQENAMLDQVILLSEGERENIAVGPSY